MPSGVFTITDIPADKVDMVVADYEMEGAQTERIDQGNGLWTVKATFPGDGEHTQTFPG